MRDVSSGKKGSIKSISQERCSEGDRSKLTDKSLSMKQDSVKKNVYHIFGR